jgi:transcriptional regulator
MNGIVGVNIKITKIEHKVKMNQNRPANDVKEIIESYRTEIGGEKGETMAKTTASHYGGEL